MPWLYPMDRAPTGIKSSAATQQILFNPSFMPFMCAQFPAINLRQLPSISQKFGGLSFEEGKSGHAQSLPPLLFLERFSPGIGQNLYIYLTRKKWQR